MRSTHLLTKSFEFLEKCMERPKNSECDLNRMFSQGHKGHGRIFKVLPEFRRG